MLVLVLVLDFLAPAPCRDDEQGLLGPERYVLGCRQTAASSTSTSTSGMSGHQDCGHTEARRHLGHAHLVGRSPIGLASLDEHDCGGQGLDIGAGVDLLVAPEGLLGSHVRRGTHYGSHPRPLSVPVARQ